MRRVILLFAVVLLASVGWSQTMTITLNDGSSIKYDMNNVKSIDFTNENSYNMSMGLLPITIYVYATKDGYQNSEVATYKFSGLVGDVDGDGLVNVADHVKLSEIIMNQ